jgi:serine/threonine protein kinase
MSQLPSLGDRENSESLNRLCNAVCDHFEAVWQAVAAGAPRPLLAHFLTNLSEPDRSFILRELIALDVYYRRIAGDTCTLADYLQPFAWLDPTWLADALEASAVANPVQTTTEGTASPGTGSVADPAVAKSGSTPPAAASPEERYIRERLHATGGIGQVWVARDQSIGRQVALKELRPDRVGNADLRTHFLTEARITGKLEHPGIVPVYEVAWNPADGQPFYAMRFIKGATRCQAAADYHQKRRQGQARPLDLRGLLDVFVSVCNVVAYAHSRGVLHRDLKGQNVVLGNYGEVFVLDWGLAKVVGTAARPAAAAAEPPGDLVPAAAQGGVTHVFPDIHFHPESPSPQVTVEGQVLGTPGYMAPEQAAGQPEQVDERTDVYGLGAILYEILTGQAPFLGKDVATILGQRRAELMQAHYPIRMITLASYNIATYYCVAAAAAQQDPMLSPGARNDASDRYLIQAIKTLEQARAAGCFLTKLAIHAFKTDKDLTLLRKRDDFRKWLKGLEAKVAR